MNRSWRSLRVFSRRMGRGNARSFFTRFSETRRPPTRCRWVSRQRVKNALSLYPSYGIDMTDEIPTQDGVGRMQFMLTMRRRGISDAAVLRALDEVPREHFVQDQFAQSAYADQALPIPCGQTISQPFVVAYMTEKLELRPEHRVLEVGTGSGYQAAILSRIVREVISVERYRTLADEARARIAALGYRT